VNEQLAKRIVRMLGNPPEEETAIDDP